MPHPPETGCVPIQRVHATPLQTHNKLPLLFVLSQTDLCSVVSVVTQSKRSKKLELDSATGSSDGVSLIGGMS